MATIPVFCFAIYLHDQQIPEQRDEINLNHSCLATLQWQMTVQVGVYEICEMGPQLLCETEHLRTGHENGRLLCGFPTKQSLAAGLLHKSFGRIGSLT